MLLQTLKPDYNPSRLASTCALLPCLTITNRNLTIKLTMMQTHFQLLP